MEAKVIDVGNDFYSQLTNRNKYQGNGQNTAKQFRERFLSALANKEIWKSNETFCLLDFSNVDTIGPSFANEAFAYFMQFTSPDSFRQKVKIINTTTTQKRIIDTELNSAYRR